MKLLKSYINKQIMLESRRLRLPYWISKDGTLSDRVLLYNNIVEAIIELSNQRKSIEEVYLEISNRFKGAELLDLNLFNLRSIADIRAKYRDRINVNMLKKKLKINTLPNWILRTGTPSDRILLYNNIVEDIIELTNQRKSVEEAYLEILDRFKDAELLDQSRFNARSINNIRAKYRDRINVNMLKGPRNLKLPYWILRTGTPSDRALLYNNIVEAIIELTNQRKSVEEAYLEILDRFKDAELLDQSRFNVRSINNIRAKYRDRINVNMLKNKLKINTLPNWILRAGIPSDRVLLYNNIVEAIIELSRQRNSVEEVYLEILDRFKDAELLDQSRFNARSINNIRAKYRDRINAII